MFVWSWTATSNRQPTLSTELPMDEVLFYSLDPRSYGPLETPWQAGLWAHIITLAKLFGPIQDLNHLIVQGEVTGDEKDRTVNHISTQIGNWDESLPASVTFDEDNFQKHKERGTGGTFVALHLGYHHCSTFLYFHSLTSSNPQPSAKETICVDVNITPRHSVPSFSVLDKNTIAR